MLGERGASPEAVATLRHNLGLDQPLYSQYAQFLFNTVRGEFGQSIVSQRPVWDEFRDRFPATLELSVVALFWSVLLGIIVGGRTGYVLFYNLPFFMQHPGAIFMLWEGGMSFHGGLIGVLVAMWLYARKT
jgi:hypothetical protein